MRSRSVVAVPPAPAPAPPQPVVAACQLCGGAIRDGDPTDTVVLDGRTGHTAPRCQRCAAADSPAAAWHLIVSTLRPGWVERMPWHRLTALLHGRPTPADGGDLAWKPDPIAVVPEYIERPADTSKPAQQPFAHITADRLHRLRSALEHEVAPAGPPQVEQALNRDAIERWPESLACWRCGLSVGPRGGRVVESESPTDEWITEEARRPRRFQRPAWDPDRQAREADRATAPRVPGTAWRECANCARDTPAAQLRRVLGDDTPAEVTERWARPALGALVIPPYAASPACTGQLDEGLERPFEHVDVAWIRDELARLLAEYRPPEPHRSGLGAPCQVCGALRATAWETLAGLPTCGECVDAFAPHPPAERAPGAPLAPDAVRSSDNRPYHHPRGRWRQGWNYRPAPPDEVALAMTPSEAIRWDQANRLCDADLICAAAAGRPTLRRPGLAEACGFHLACEHPNYGPTAAWHGRWAYLADNPHGQDRQTLVNTVSALVDPPAPEPPQPAPRPSPFPRLTTRDEVLAEAG